MDSSAPNKIAKLTLSKGEKLIGKKEISELFEKGSFFYLKPLKIYFQTEKKDFSEDLKVIFSVPKSRFPKASQRNRIKRKLREAYRLSKPDLVRRLSNYGIDLKKLGLVYVEDELFSFALIRERIVEIPQRIFERSKRLK
jgi:ribonuclease P protein component